MTILSTFIMRKPKTPSIKQIMTEAGYPDAYKLPRKV